MCKFKNTADCFSIRIHVFNSGVLAVFGGETTGAIALDTLETLNGSSWQNSFLKGPRNAHAMVQLPCSSL